MATVLLAVAAVLGLIGLAWLGWLVVALRWRVDRLEMELRQVRDTVGAEWRPRRAPEPGPAVDSVPVITGVGESQLSQPGDPAAASVVSLVAADPMIKLAAFTYGVRRALGEEQRMRVVYAFRKELKRRRRMQRQEAVRPPRNAGWRP